MSSVGGILGLDSAAVQALITADKTDHQYYPSGNADVASSARLTLTSFTISDGFAWMDFTRTAKSATSRFKLHINVFCSFPSITSGIGMIVVKDSVTLVGADVSTTVLTTSTSNSYYCHFVVDFLPGDTSSHTYYIRLGRTTSNTVTVTALGKTSFGDIGYCPGVHLAEYEP